MNTSLVLWTNSSCGTNSSSLDVYITQNDSRTSVTADPSTISDHSLIIVNVKFPLAISFAFATITRRPWTEFDCDVFHEDLVKSTLLTSLSVDCGEFFLCYDDTLHQLWDKHKMRHFGSSYGEVALWHCGSTLFVARPRSKLATGEGLTIIVLDRLS